VSVGWGCISIHPTGPSETSVPLAAMHNNAESVRTYLVTREWYVQREEPYPFGSFNHVP
jgi:hypothetical protein